MIPMISLLFSLCAQAGTLEGVTLPDTVVAGGQTLVLNGIGLREKLVFDIYVGGLYLPVKSHDAAAIIALDAPKRVTMHFLFPHVTKGQIADTLSDGIDKYPEYVYLKPQLAPMIAAMEDMNSGDEMAYEYVPGKGTTLYIKGVNKGTIPGLDVMTLVFSMYVGPHPATEQLKAGMLGG